MIFDVSVMQVISCAICMLPNYVFDFNIKLIQKCTFVQCSLQPYLQCILSLISAVSSYIVFIKWLGCYCYYFSFVVDFDLLAVVDEEGRISILDTRKSGSKAHVKSTDID